MKRIALLALGIGAALSGLAYYFFYTTAGSSLMARLVIAHYVKPGRLTIQRATGSLSEGLGLRGVQLGELAGALKDSSLGIQQIDLAPLSVSLTQPLHVEVRDVRLQPTAMAREVTIARLDGEFTGDFVFYDVLLQDPTRFPPGSTVKIERLDATLPLQIEHIKRIYNGVLRLPDADPILFYGTQQDGHMEAHVYTHSVDFDRLLRMVSSNPRGGSIKAVLTDGDLVITGSVDDMKVGGNLELSRLWREGFSVSGCPAKLALTVKDVTTAPKVHGTVTVLGGTLTARQTTVAIQQGRVNFAGDPTAPTFDVKGVSKIGDTKIFITLKGNLDKPDLQLSSDPPKPPGLLLVMLATGKPWKGAQEGLAQGTIPLDLAADFIDYFAFGGLGGKLADFAREPVDAEDQERVEGLGFGVVEHFLEARPVHVGAGLGVAVDLEKCPVVAVLTLTVGFEAVLLCAERVLLVILVGRDAGVAGDPWWLSVHA